MSEAFADLPWRTRWWARMNVSLPKWYQNWRTRRLFWQYASKGAKVTTLERAGQTQSSSARDHLIRMYACAELNHRNGDDSLQKILEKQLPGSRLTLRKGSNWPQAGQVDVWSMVNNVPPVTLHRYWVDNRANTTKRMPWE